MGCRKKSTEDLDEEQKKILIALDKIKEPAGCKDIAASSRLATPKVTGKLRGLKTKGYVESPIKGKYVVTEAGKAELKK